MPQRHATIADLPPEFDSFDARDLQYWLRATRSQIGLERLGACASQAHAMLAAHMLSRVSRSTGETGSAGLVSKEKVGDVEVTYAVAPTVDDLQSTVYGQRYAALRRGASFVGGVLTL